MIRKNRRKWEVVEPDQGETGGNTPPKEVKAVGDTQEITDYTYDTNGN